jgi:hypothetical protein
VGFVVNKVALGQIFHRVLWFSPCQFHSDGAPLQGKKKISIIRLHNKPQGCGASIASAAGPLKKQLSASRPSMFNPRGKSDNYPLNRALGGPRSLSGR